jgi:flagellin
MSLGVLNNLSAMYAENNLNNTNNSLNTCCSSCLPDRRSTPARTTRPAFRWSTACRPTSRPSTQSQTNATGRRGPAAGGRWRSLASDKPAQPGRDAGYRSLERHPQRLAGYGGQPGVPVDSVGSLNIGSTTTYNQERSSTPTPTSTPATLARARRSTPEHPLAVFVQRGRHRRHDGLPIDQTNNTLATLQSAINGVSALGVTANVITNGDGTQSLTLADTNSNGGALTVGTTAGTTQAPVFAAGTGASSVLIQTQGTQVAGNQYIASSASTVTFGTGGTDSGAETLTLGTSITITNSIANDLQTQTFVVGAGNDVNTSTGTHYTANQTAGAAGDTLAGLATAINAQNSTLGVYATVGSGGITLTTGSWNSETSTGTPTALTGQNVAVTQNNLTAASTTDGTSTALQLYTPTVGGAALSNGSKAVNILDAGASAAQVGDTVTGSITFSNDNGTYTYTAQAGDTWTTLMNDIAGSDLNVTASFSATAGGAGTPGLILTNNVKGDNPINVATGSTLQDSIITAPIVNDTGAPAYNAGVDNTPATPSTAILQMANNGIMTDTGGTASQLGGAIQLKYNGNSQIFIMGAPPSTGNLMVPGAIYTGGTSVTSLVNAISADGTLGLSAFAPGGGTGGIYLQGRSRRGQRHPVE